MMDGTGVFRKLVFLVIIVFALAVVWQAIQGEEKTPAKPRVLKRSTSQPVAEPPVEPPVVEEPVEKVRPKRPAGISSKVKGQIRSLEHALQQVSKKTRDRRAGTLSKRDALVRAYLQAIAAARGMERAKYTPTSSNIRKWTWTLSNAGDRLGGLARTYPGYSRAPNSYSSNRRRRDGSGAAWCERLCKELNRQKGFVSGLKPAQAKGKIRKARIARHPNARR